jgi:hypothetical protein
MKGDGRYEHNMNIYKEKDIVKRIKWILELKITVPELNISWAGIRIQISLYLCESIALVNKYLHAYCVTQHNSSIDQIFSYPSLPHPNSHCISSGLLTTFQL